MCFMHIPTYTYYVFVCIYIYIYIYVIMYVPIYPYPQVHAADSHARAYHAAWIPKSTPESRFETISTLVGRVDKQQEPDNLKTRQSQNQN